jgi:hypothetical protein
MGGEEGGREEGSVEVECVEAEGRSVETLSTASMEEGERRSKRHLGSTLLNHEWH